MPDLIEQMYCSQQIKIPPNLPFILKQYAKAAIRTQPYDLLHWSAAYFRAKANNTPPPVKERLEYPPVDTPSRLSPGFLKVLHKQLGANEFVIDHILHEKWLGVCLDKEALLSMQKIGNMIGRIPWLRFVAVAAGHLCSSLSKTMVLVCEVLTEEPDGGSAMIPLDVFIDLYEFLARLDCGPKPPEIKASEEGSLSCPTPTSAAESSTLPADFMQTGETGVSEKDSTAGLMVWPDLKPEEKVDRVQSPKHTEEIGATSELGIEVLDDAKGTVTEIVTIYSAQKQVEFQSDISIPSPPPIIELPRFDETVLSHSSLQENSDWIKIESKKGDIFEEIFSTVSPLETTIKGSEETTSDGVEKTSDHHSKEEIPLEDLEKQEGEDLEKQEGEDLEKQEGEDLEKQEGIDLEKQEGLSQDDKKTAELDPSEQEPSSKSISYDSKSKATTASNKTIPSEVEQAINESEHEEKSEHSEDSVFPPEEAVTVQQFIKDNEGSSVSSSLAEIRKGYFKDKSGYQIERSSSENTVRAAETIVRLEDDSLDSVNQEQDSARGKQESSSRVLDLPDESEESIGYGTEVYWEHVPGIGPVIPESQILAVVEYMNYWASKQHGMVMPRNINHILCPPLDLPPPEEE